MSDILWLDTLVFAAAATAAVALVASYFTPAAVDYRTTPHIAITWTSITYRGKHINGASPKTIALPANLSDNKWKASLPDLLEGGHVQQDINPEINVTEAFDHPAKQLVRCTSLEFIHAHTGPLSHIHSKQSTNATINLPIA
ncbi:hypothetical protein C8R46DRAFT_1230389 [Mycena filopes]|nr:hypothetical protein C8R46DRAFT_1230389 [Mycena filopes]